MKNSWISVIKELPELYYISEEWRMSPVVVVANIDMPGEVYTASYWFLEGNYKWICSIEGKKIEVTHWQYFEGPTNDD